MAPKSSNAENGGEATMSILSARDAKLITVALKSLPSNVKSAVNFDVIVSEMGLKDTKCARESFRQLCKKHGWFEADVCLNLSPRVFQRMLTIISGYHSHCWNPFHASPQENTHPTIFGQENSCSCQLR